jgi:hypothetical protein
VKKGPKTTKKPVCWFFDHFVGEGVPTTLYDCDSMAEREEIVAGAAGEAAGRRNWVRDMKAKKHVEGTDDSYGGKVATFVSFLCKTNPQVLRDGFRRGYDEIVEPQKKKRGQKTRRDYVIEQIGLVDKDRLAETAILDTASITEDMVTQWLAEFKGKRGATPHKSVFGSAQSALVDLYKRHDAIFPQAFYGSIGDVQKGAQRKRAQEKVEGLVPMEEGKAAIPGHLYLELVEALLKSGEDIFCHTFAVCSWVLMCRVSNVAELRGAHLCWENDSVVISIVKHKADQGGERTDPKHCYANPFNPSACVVTALAIYFAVYGPPKAPTDHVFEGNRQHERFVEAIRRLLQSNPRLKEELERLGITAEDIAAHSFRKGGRSFAQGGTTGGPSTPSILLRGLWALEGIDKKYVRYEAAADQFIGRILAMLDINSPDFAVLFPHFGVVDDAVLAAVRSCFPAAPKQLECVLLQCLASLVFHRETLRRDLHKDHPLFKSVAFAQGVVDSLAGRVALAFEDDKISPTGVPPHVSIQRQLRQVSESVESLPIRVRAAIAEEFEQRALDAGSITRNVLEQMLEGMMARLKDSMNPQQLLPPRPAERHAEDGQFQTWMVQGQMRRVPEDFTFDTTLPARTLFQLYCLGDQNAHIGPYRQLESRDFVSAEQKKRLSDMFALMRPVESAMKQQQRWQRRPNVDQVNEMWETGANIIAVEARTPKGRKRRIKQLAWSTHLREYRKRPQVEGGDDNSD